jgi:pectin methylesterase-like acyl-CoA thioesterase
LRTLLLLSLAALIVVAGTCSAAPALAGSAKGSAIQVCPSGCAYSSIQDAIDAAASGSTITIAAGSYKGVLNSDGKNLTLAGAGAAQTTINGGRFTVAVDGGFEYGGYGPAVEVDSGTVTISGVTITAGWNLNGSATEGGGIYNAGTLKVRNSTVSDNDAFSGSGIYSTGTLTLDSTTVSGDGDRSGGGPPCTTPARRRSRTARSATTTPWAAFTTAAR